MALDKQSLTLNIIADDRVLKRVLADAKRNVSTFSKDVETAGKKNSLALGGAQGAGFFGRGSKGNQALRGLASGTGLGSAALFGSGAFIGSAVSAAAIQKSVTAASDLNEQITKSQQVFGASDKAILRWSQDTAKNLGISQTAALEAAGTFGNLFKAQGFGTAKNSQLSRQLVQLASDLASFNNVNPAQVLEDLNSAIVGEIEPVRKYGVDLRIARVQQEALAETGKSTAKELTRQELTLARLHILFKDTTAAQGDFKRTQSGLANQQRILSAQVQNLSADLGTLLLPAVDGVVTGINEALGITLKFTGALKALAGVKIPAIHIPFFFDFPGGGKVGSIAGKIGKFAGFAAISPAGAVVKTVHDALVSDAKNKSKGDTPKLAADFSAVLGGFARNALADSQKAGGFLKAPRLNQPKLVKNLIENLNLKLDRADLTKSSADNIATLRELVQAYRLQVKLGSDVKNATKDLISTRKQLQQETEQAKSDKFSNLIDNLSLGVDKAQITKGLGDDIAALQVVKAGLLKQIKAGVDVNSAQHQLASVNAQIASTQEQIKQDGIDKILASLQLGVDKAALTKGLADDLSALQKQAAGIRAQIKAGNDVENNQSQLVSVLQNIKSVQDQIAQNAKDASQAKLFKQIGLSSTGSEIIPGVANLKKQFDQLTGQDLSGVSKKLTNRLAGVGKALSNPILESLPEVRSAIRDLFAAIRDELNKGGQGPLTKTSSLNTNKIIKGLGLDPATAKEIRARLSKFNSAGVALSGSGVAATAGGFPNFGTAPTVVVNVDLDGKQVAKSVTVHQDKRKRRNPTQKRGPSVHNGGI